ncbi:TonB-dependent receptor [Flavobacterium cyanobacteriorum]|uniref:TonB-dependent receptor n=1 Tax=Flavobacterium cyanobacteriorum TaxID=2022802 RepID=A0A255YY40_9FLAO|nr:TonB-dependent receptor [Flavobacterium cyanobacteriorum]OYQ34081.1 TonB-dependent receptor [Flavobacterium cyanobacteriorum]
MTLKKLVIVGFLLACQYVAAQRDTLMQLREVVITDTQLRAFSASQSTQQLNDSVIKRNPASLTSLLNYNTVIYFKENGPGMVSSPSFRGTTAQQTAVIWNGININSQLNGLTDFNTLSTRDFKDITVRAGGGSVIYGSSAIGGSIHLNTGLTFGQAFCNELRTEYGSFDTKSINYKAGAGAENTAVQVSISHNSSDNDFEFPGYNIINENGQYHNTSLNAGVAYRFNGYNTLRFYSYAFSAKRHFSRTVTVPSKSMYRDINTRNLLEWLYDRGRFTSKVKVAYLTEQYKYYEDFRQDIYDEGEVKTWLIRYDLSYRAGEAITMNIITDFTKNSGSGSDIMQQKRQIGSATLLLKHRINSKLNYEAGLRREVTDAYDSPLLFSAGAVYDAFSFYTLKLNASRNFRIPTFNDLYWQGSGNPDLNPETSIQAEIGNHFHFGGLNIAMTGYYIKLRDMLRWVPRGNQWGPENVGRVSTYGLEGLLNWQKQLGRHRFDVAATYAYTISREDGKSEQLIYVPMHKATASASYSYGNTTLYYRHLFNGEVYTTSDNTASVDSYNVSSAGAEYHINILAGIDIGAQVLNLWDEAYENVAFRPLPGRHYNMYLNFKF